MSPILLDPGALALAALLVLANAAASLALRLGLGRKLVTAGARAVIQLLLLGYVLVLVFESDSPWIVIGLMLAMAFVAGVEAVRRTTRRVPGIYKSSLGVVMVSSMAITFYALFVILRVEPWYAPQYAIPILGMVLGNTLNGISLGLETVMAGFDEKRAEIELLLAHGATRREASREVVRRAVRTGLIPTLNMMVAAGTVSIPGMMTGQILAGEDPMNAARYQIFILFCIAGGVAIGTVGVVFAVARLVFDDRDRLRTDRIRHLR
ncbi:MAG: iron export ABC transporter permease subunit FetB [Planctomycetota bacterium]|nr:MAG: iron export ABC transporter permease subunit FetB [Planctomycetota bacterium]